MSLNIEKLSPDLREVYQSVLEYINVNSFLVSLMLAIEGIRRKDGKIVVEMSGEISDEVKETLPPTHYGAEIVYEQADAEMPAVLGDSNSVDDEMPSPAGKW